MGFLGIGDDKVTTQTQTFDPATQRHIDRMRRGGAAGSGVALNQPGSFFTGPNTQSIQDIIAPFLNPYQDQVIGGINQQFDRSRGLATVAGNQAATAAGAFNSSRHGVAEGVRLGEIDAAEAQQVGGFLSDQFNTAVNQGIGYNQYQNSLMQQKLQEPLFRQQMSQQLLQGSLGPTSGSVESRQKGSVFGDLMGLGTMAVGAFTGNPGLMAGGAQMGGGGGAPMGGQFPTFPGGGPGHPTLGVPYRPPIQRPAGY